MANRMHGTLGSDSGAETRDDGSGRQSGDLEVEQFKQAWRQIPEADRIAAMQEVIRNL
jgi:hypothetical protein